MLRLAWKTVRHSPKRLLLTIVAVVLSVSFISGTFVLTGSFQQSFGTMFDEIYGGSDLSVRLAPDDDANPTDSWSSIVPGFDEAVVAQVAGVDGVENAEPGVSGVAVLLKADGTPVVGPPTLVLNWTTNLAVNNVTLVDGNAPESSSDMVMDIGSAERAGFSIGDTVILNRMFEGENFSYELVGLIKFGETNSLNGATLTFFTYEEAQVLARQEGQVAGISVTVTEGADPATVLTAVQDVLPDGLEAVTSQQLVEESNAAIGDITAVMNNIVLAFALIAVFVGAMLITNTFQTIVTQRSREIGLLRAIAASPRQILAMILLEASIVGVVGSVVGIVVGYVNAVVIKTLLSAGGGMGNNLGVLSLPTASIVWGLATGLLTTVVAALLPALHASRTTPMEALRDSATRSRKSLTQRTRVGLAFLGAGVIAMIMGFATDLWNTAAWVGVSGALLMIGTALVAARLIGPFATLLRIPFRKFFGVNGTLAANNSRREPRRTANTAAALMLGVLLLSLMTTVASSIKSMVNDLLVGSTSADFIVTSPNPLQDPFATLSDADRMGIERLSGVEVVLYDGATEAILDGNVVTAVGLNSKSADQVYEWETEPGFDTLDNGEVFVKPFILDQGYEVGDTLTVEGPDATLQLVITGVVNGAQDEPLWVTWEDARVLNEGVGVVSLWVVARDDMDLDQLKIQIEEILEGNTRVAVNTPDEYSKAINTMLDTILALIAAMLSMALVIAIFGVANTLYLSVTERTREIGLLRAVGVGRKSIWSMITLESVLISLLGAVLGFVLGVTLGAGLVMSLDLLSDYGVTVPWWNLVGYTILAVIAGIIAALLPARRASKLNILDAISSE